MKNYLLVVSILTAATAVAQRPSCCSPAIEGFASMGDDMEFVAIHDEPLALEATDLEGTMISYSTADGKTASAYFIPQEGSTDYLLVYNEWWGLNDHIKVFAERLHADLNINVIALDMYDGKVATTREAAGTYMQALDASRGQAIVEGAIALANEQSNNAARFVQIGWCMGGGWSLQSALLAESRSMGCVMYYGMPEKDIERLKTMNGPVLFVFANRDKWINRDVVEGFQKDMNKADRSLEILEFDADHAFANPSNPSYNEQAAEEAYTASLTFLQNALSN